MSSLLNTEIRKKQETKKDTNHYEERPTLASLKKAWGADFKKNLSLAKKLIQQYGDDEVKKLLENTPVGNDPAAIERAYRFQNEIARRYNDLNLDLEANDRHYPNSPLMAIHAKRDVEAGLKNAFNKEMVGAKDDFIKTYQFDPSRVGVDEFVPE